MIVAEKKIRVPFKEYEILIKSNVMRKLTIMEWTLLHVVKDYSAFPQYQDKTLSFFFEELLGMTRSELLIRPCLNDMIGAGLITVDNYSPYDMVGRILVKSVKFTELGAAAAQRGYVPGDVRETGEKLFYNLLKGEYTESPGSEYGSGLSSYSYVYCDEAVADEYQFEPDAVRRGINRGKLWNSKYHDNNVEAIEVSATKDSTAWYTSKLTIDVDPEGTITSNFPYNRYTEDAVVHILSEKLPWREEPESMPVEWDRAKPLPEQVFCGDKILNEVIRAAISEKTILLHSALWDAVSDTIQELSDHTIVVFSSPRFSLNIGKNTIIRVAQGLPDDQVLVLYRNAALEEYSIPMSYHGKSTKVCSAVYRDEPNLNFADAAKELLHRASEKEPDVAVAFLLPFMDNDIEQFAAVVSYALRRMTSAQDQMKYLTKLIKSAEKSKLTIGDLGTFNADIAEKLQIDDVIQLSNDLTGFGKQVYKNQRQAFENLILSIAEKCKFATINDYLRVLSTLVTSFDKVDTKEFVLRADDITKINITDQMVELFYGQVWGKSAVRVPEMLTVAKPYNRIHQLRTYIEKAIGYQWSEQNERDYVLEQLLKCDDMGKVMEAAHGLQEAVKSIPEKCTPDIVRSNIESLMDLISSFGIQENEGNTTYLVDTCVFMHTPRILDYFKADEIVRIPFTVLQELDYHKDNNPDQNLKRTAAFACKQIEAYVNSEGGKNLKIFLEPEDYASLLPGSFDSRKHDNLILSAAFRYKALHPVVLTDDTNFRNISRSQGIKVKAWKAFVDERGGESIRSTDLPMKDLEEIVRPETAILEKTAKAEKPEEENQDMAAYLAQPIEILKLPPYNLSGKNVKTLQSAGFVVLNDLYITTTSAINQKLKSTSARTMARQAHDRLATRVDNEFGKQTSE